MRFALLALVAALAQAPAPYSEPYRPQFHFSPRVNWTNDPNGLVFFEGEYHLFFQYNPFGDTWGHMSWGHAVSTDLVHWRELPVALREENGIMIFTGSTVVDTNNTSGFCLNQKPCMVAVYTGHTMKTESRPSLQTQNLAYSNDRGRTWTKYEGNPVLDLHMTDFRDPKVFWSKSARRWVMAVSLPDEHKVRFYGSPDLKRWEQLSEFGPAAAVAGQWECPELFELPVDGKAETRWVLKVGLNPGALQGGSGEQYFVGRFDGTEFHNDNPPPLTLWTDYGKDCYCALTFNNLPANQPQVMLGWMNNWQYANTVPTSPWRGQMTVPRRLALETGPEGIRLIQKPVDSIAQLRQRHIVSSAATKDEFESALGSGPVELQLTAEPRKAAQAVWTLSAGDASLRIGYDRTRQVLFVDRSQFGASAFSKDFPAMVTAPFVPAGSRLQIRVLIDRSSVEVFADGGRLAMTNLVFPPGPIRRLTFSATPGGGPSSAELWTLRSIW